jgi:hypothetical protein
MRVPRVKSRSICVKYILPKNYFPRSAQLRGEGFVCNSTASHGLGIVIEAGNGVVELPLLLAGGKELICNSS